MKNPDTTPIVIAFAYRALRAAAVAAALLGGALSCPAETALPLVPVGHPGNLPDAAGRGDVPVAFQAGKYEINNTQYTAFLNAVAADDRYGLFNPGMEIARSGAAGRYRYSTSSGNKPVRYVSWFDAARFANWLHNGQPSGVQNTATTEDGAYPMSGLSGAGPRKATARFFLPTDDEWFKAAYYDGSRGAYTHYAVRTDTPPLPASPPGNGPSANYDKISRGPVDVGSYSHSPSYYGTYDQNGNVWEWVEDQAAAGDRRIRGGSWDDYALLLSAAYTDSQPPLTESEFIGFRVAASEDTPAPGAGLWGDAVDLGNGWKWLAWFGVFAEVSSPWIYHETHGYMYCVGEDTRSIWFWTLDMGWLWTSDSFYPYLWRRQPAGWLWYVRDSSGPRLFYSVASGTWESH